HHTTAPWTARAHALDERGIRALRFCAARTLTAVHVRAPAPEEVLAAQATADARVVARRAGRKAGVVPLHEAAAPTVRDVAVARGAGAGDVAERRNAF